MSSSRAAALGRARAWIVTAYVVAAAAGITAALLLTSPSSHALVRAAIGDLAATIAVFTFSAAFRNSSFYDAYWSVWPPVAGFTWLLSAPPGVDRVRQAVALGLCTLWGVRLTYNWARGFSGLHHEDWRYVEIARKTGRAYWLASFLGIHLVPTAQTFAGSIGLYVALTATCRPFGALDLLAAAVTLGAIVCEAVADQQLFRFMRRPSRKPDEPISEGLWAYCRHPNYFGEITFWWGLFGFGLAADPGPWRSMIVGPSVITLMVVFVSVPLMEKRQLERRPAFAESMRTTSMIIPWFRKT